MRSAVSPAADAHDKHEGLFIQHCKESQLQLPTHWISLRARSMRLLQSKLKAMYIRQKATK
jgi:hypothetical protein